MALLGRIIVILFALWLATMAAGIVWSIGLLGPQWPAMSAIPASVSCSGRGIHRFRNHRDFTVSADVDRCRAGRSFFGALAAGPCLWRRCACAAWPIKAPLRRSGEESIDHPPPPISREFEIVAAAGIAFGVTYWLIAGRKAGRWRER